MCGPSIDYPTNYFLQDKCTADMEDVERRVVIHVRFWG
jgi:hypothetical protein